MSVYVGAEPKKIEPAASRVIAGTPTAANKHFFKNVGPGENPA
jgi:hypothetical protein